MAPKGVWYTVARERYWKTKAFWEDFVERLVGTFSEALLGALPVAYIADIDWINALYIALFASLAFVLKGFAAGWKNSETGASLGTAIPRSSVRTVDDEDSPTSISAEQGSDFREGTPVLPEEPFR